MERRDAGFFRLTRERSNTPIAVNRAAVIYAEPAEPSGTYVRFCVPDPEVLDGCIGVHVLEDFELVATLLGEGEP